MYINIGRERRGKIPRLENGDDRGRRERRWRDHDREETRVTESCELSSERSRD